MLKKCTFRFLFTLLAMAGMSVAAYNGTPTAKANFATETINNKTCYKIGSAEDLYGFAAIVNGTNGNTAEPTACGVLTADITVNENMLATAAGDSKVNATTGAYTGNTTGLHVWTPIGTSESSFAGTFDGQGHTISGLYFNNPDADNVGLFGYTGAASIDNVGVVDSYFRGGQNVGSIVGQAEPTVTVSGTLSKALTVTKSYNKGVVTGTDNVGGLVGKNGNVKFSYNMGSVTGTSNVGGLVGSNIYQSQNKFEINGSYNVGLVKMGTVSGNAVLGEGCPTTGNTSAVKNVYYLEGVGGECLGANSMTSYEFADGFVAITLHNDRTVTGANIWGQVVGADKTPLLTGEIVFPITLDNSDNCYEISSAEDLYVFAAIVNSGFKSDACGKLTENIVVNENVLTSAGELNTAPVGGFKEWTPIGLEKNSFGQDISFQGTFHGQGHTISGLYFNDTEAGDVGLFGDVSGTVTIDSVGLVDSYINAGGWVGGLVGFARGSLTISDSYNASSVTSYNTFGGLVGAAGSGSSLAISNSYNVGSLNGGGYGGGLVGYANALVVSNSYNAGPIYNSDELKALVGGITSSVDDASTVTNSFNYGAISYPSNIEVVVDDLVAIGDESIVTVTNSFSIGESRFEGNGSTKKSEDEFADGTVLAALRNSEDGEVWRQYKNDAYPTFVKKSGTTFEPNEDGYYEIATADDLYKFAEIVNGGNATAKAKLMNDITVNDYVLADANGVSKVDSDGAYIGADSASFRKWTPIGTDDVPFAGTFDGQGYTISGLYINAPNAANVGLFGHVYGEDETVSISNIGIEDSYFKAESGVGGVVGYAEGGALDMKNVFNAAVVVGASYVGGIVGYVFLDEYQALSMSNVYNVGSINCTDASAGQAGGLVGDFVNDLVGSKITIKNSYNYGNVVGGNPLVGVVDYEIEDAVTVTNSFYLGSSSSGAYGTAKSAADFSNGTVYAALHSAEDVDVWFQSPGDKYPTLSQEKNGPAVYEVTLNYPKAGSPSEYDSETISYVEGFAKSLPTMDKNGNPILGWYTTGSESSPITEISTSTTGVMTLFPKMYEPVNGCYEIATADQLYLFAAVVNGGNGEVCGKLTANIVVNQNVLGTDNANVDADGDYIGADSASFRKWTPIGNNSKPFKGTFDGQGYAISGLYFDDKGAIGVGLFGNVKNNASIKNVGVEDSYFRGQNSVGGILGRLDESSSVDLENVYNASVVVASLYYAGGIVGYDYGAESHVTNAYNVGQIFAVSHAGGIVGRNYSDKKSTIQNSFNYGSVSAGSNAGVLIGTVAGTLSVSNSFYLGSSSSGDYGTNKSADDFANGDVFVALHSAEGGYVWVQAPGDKYPTIDINATSANIVVLDWSTATDSTTLEDEGFSEGDIVVVKGGKQFYANGEIYEGILSAEQIAAIGSNNLYPISGVKLENVSGELVATLNGNSDETLVIPMDIAVSKVVYQRDLTGGVFQTIMLPFDAQIGSRSDVKFYKFKEVTADYEVNVSTVKDKILANKPYIVVANSGITQIEFAPEDGLTLVKATSEIYEARKGNWVMKGVYKTKVFEDGDSELGRAYGFAGQQQVDTKIGEFVKVGTEAFADPMRVYLVNDPVSLARPGQYGVNSFARIRAVPKSLSVVIVDDDEEDAEDETMVVKQITVVPTVVPTSRWFDMKGRALNAKPTAKGTYYYNGQRVIIK